MMDLPLAIMFEKKTSRILQLVLLQALPALWLCRGMFFGDLLLSEEILDMNYGWQKRLDDIGWSISEALWDPTSFCGIPFLANPAARALYPPSLFARLLTPFSPESVFGGLIFVHLWLVALGGAVWLRRIVRFAPAYHLGGWLFAANGYLVVRTGLADPGFLYALTWVPWILYFQSNLGRRGSSLWLALFLALEVLAGRPDMTYYLGILMVGRFVWVDLFRLRKGSGRRRAARSFGSLAWAGILAFLLTAPLLLPTLELQTVSGNRSGEADFEFAATDSLYPPQFLASLFPNSLGNPREQMVPGRASMRYSFWKRGGGYHEVFFYFGQATLALALLGLLFGMGRERFYWGTVILFAVLLSMGRYFPIYGHFFDWIPGWNRFRVPPRCLMVVTPAVAYLAARGLERLLGGRAHFSKVAKGAVASVLFLAAGIAVVSLLSDWIVTNLVLSAEDVALHAGPDPNLALRAQADGLGVLRKAVLVSGLLLLIPWGGVWTGLRLGCSRRVLAWGMAGVILCDLLWINGPSMRSVLRDDFERTFGSDPFIETVRDQENPGRLVVLGEVMQYQRRATHPWFFPGRAFAYDIENVSGYGPFLLGDYLETFDRIDPVYDLYNRGLLLYLFQFKETRWEIFRWLNASHVVSIEELPAPFELVEKKVYWGERGFTSTLFFYEYPDRHPRAFLYPPEDLEEFPEPDPSRGEVAIVERSPSRVTLRATAASACRLALLETWYPGWKCTVGGEEAEIVKTAGAFRSIALPQGEHEIVFDYDPLSWKAGRWLCGLGCLLLVLTAGIGRRRRRLPTTTTPGA